MAAATDQKGRESSCSHPANALPTSAAVHRLNTIADGYRFQSMVLCTGWHCARLVKLEALLRQVRLGVANVLQARQRRVAQLHHSLKSVPRPPPARAQVAARTHLKQLGVGVGAVAEGEQAVANAAQRVRAKGDQRPQRQLHRPTPKPRSNRQKCQLCARSAYGRLASTHRRPDELQRLGQRHGRPSHEHCEPDGQERGHRAEQLCCLRHGVGGLMAETRALAPFGRSCVSRLA